MLPTTHSETHVLISICTPENAYPRFHDAILSTKYFDDESELAYFGYRYYSPEMGRWINRDPVGRRGGLNVYQFVLNRPITRRDYLGLAAFMQSFNNLSLEFVTYKWVPRFQQKRLQLGDEAAGKPGVEYYAAACADERGDLQFVQNIRTEVTQTFKDGSKAVLSSAGRYVVDASRLDPPDFVPGIGIVWDDVYEEVPIGAPSMTLPASISMYDTPNVGVLSRMMPFTHSLERVDHFKLYLMFKPQNGTRYTLGLAEWGWSGRAARRNPDSPVTLEFGTSYAAGGRETSQTPVPLSAGSSPQLKYQVVDNEDGSLADFAKDLNPREFQ